MNAANSNTAENLFIHHKVYDYAAWRTGYNENERSRAAAGITNGRVYRSADDPNDVLVLQDATDMAKARAWLGGEDMKTAMRKSGVVGSPSVRFASQVAEAKL
jgi:hypothetical protein